MIAWELRQKGVNETTIQSSLQDVSDESAAYQLAQKRWPRLAKLATARERRQKLTEHLARHGFAYDIIRDVISKLEQENGCTTVNDDEPENSPDWSDDTA